MSTETPMLWIDDVQFTLPFELLRIYSPSAEAL